MRAQAVADVLVLQGRARDVITVHGYGETQAVRRQRHSENKALQPARRTLDHDRREQGAGGGSRRPRPARPRGRRSRHPRSPEARDFDGRGPFRAARRGLTGCRPPAVAVPCAAGRARGPRLNGRRSDRPPCVALPRFSSHPKYTPGAAFRPGTSNPFQENPPSPGDRDRSSE